MNSNDQPDQRYVLDNILLTGTIAAATYLFYIALPLSIFTYLDSHFVVVKLVFYGCTRIALWIGPHKNLMPVLSHKKGIPDFDCNIFVCHRNGMEEKWRAVFDKVFGELRINHPADEWTLRLVDQLTPIKGAEELAPPTPEPVRLVEEVVNKEMISMEAAEKAEKTEEIPTEVKEVNQEASPSLPQVDDSIAGQDIIDGPATSTETVELPVTDTSIQQPVEAENAEVSLDVSQQEKAAEPLDMQRDQPVVEPDENLVSGHEDNRVDATTGEIQVDQVQVHLEASGEAAKQGDQGESNECPDEAAEKLQEVETGSASGLEAQDSGEQVETERENEPVLIHNGQETQEQQETVVCNEPETQSCTEQLEPVPSAVQDIAQQETNDTTVASDTIETDTANGQVTEEESVTATHVDQVQTTPETKEEEIVELSPITVEDVADVVAEQVEKLIENDDNQEKCEDKETEKVEPVADVQNESDGGPIETHFDMTTTELPTVIHVNNDQPPLAAAEEVKDTSSLLFNEERLIGDPDPPRQVEELEVAPVQVAPARSALRLGASSPQLASSSNGDGQPKASSSKKSPGKSSENELIRKPEWMRRPLVRKGSVGRFLGRMKDTMQSKRFHPDRLPVVPPPQPEPPKRPPRRKTLANLDMSRESETASKEHSIVQSPPPPATPKSAPVTDFESKSATLRSTTSDRKRKNSVGRFIGRVLSTKHLNATEGTAAEEAPLLHQEPQTSAPQSPTTPSTPAPSEKSKRGPAALAVNVAVNDMGIFIRRILRPKPAATEESKDKPSPQRPPPPIPPSRHQTPCPNDTTDSNAEQGKPVIKCGKVHFECQVITQILHCLRSASIVNLLFLI